MSERICHSPHTLQFQQQKFTAGFRVCGTRCCHTSDRTWTVDISSNHWKFMCLVFRPNGPRHIVTNCFSVHYMKLTLYWACEYVTSTHWCCGCVVACLVSVRHHKQFKRQSLWSRAVVIASWQWQPAAYLTFSSELIHMCNTTLPFDIVQFTVSSVSSLRSHSVSGWTNVEFIYRISLPYCSYNLTRDIIFFSFSRSEYLAFSRQRSWWNSSELLQLPNIGKVEKLRESRQLTFRQYIQGGDMEGGPKSMHCLKKTSSILITVIEQGYVITRFQLMSSLTRKCRSRIEVSQ